MNIYTQSHTVYTTTIHIADGESTTGVSLPTAVGERFLAPAPQECPQLADGLLDGRLEKHGFLQAMVLHQSSLVNYM